MEVGMERDGGGDVGCGCECVVDLTVTGDGGLFLFSLCKFFMDYLVCGIECSVFGAFCSQGFQLEDKKLRKADSYVFFLSPKPNPLIPSNHL